MKLYNVEVIYNDRLVESMEVYAENEEDAKVVAIGVLEEDLEVEVFLSAIMGKVMIGNAFYEFNEVVSEDIIEGMKEYLANKIKREILDKVEFRVGSFVD